MAADAEGSRIHENGMSQQTSARQRDSSGQNDSSSELIRWRADQLLDEMMLGAVDVSAADRTSSADRTANSALAKPTPANNLSPNRTTEPHGAGITHIDDRRLRETESKDSSWQNGQDASRLDAVEPNHASPSNGGEASHTASESFQNNVAANEYVEQAASFPPQPSYGENGAGYIDDASDVGRDSDEVTAEPKWMDDDWRTPPPDAVRPADHREAIRPGSGPGEESEKHVQGPDRGMDDAEQVETNDGYLFSSALRSEFDDLRAPSLSGEDFAEESGLSGSENRDDGAGSRSRQPEPDGGEKGVTGQQDSPAAYGRPVYENFPGERPTSGGGQVGSGIERRSWQDATLPRVQSGGGFYSASSQSVSGGSTVEAGYGNSSSNEPGVTHGHDAPSAETGSGAGGTTTGGAQMGVYASPMSVSPMGKKIRSTLLPRMSTLDVDSLNQEILALHEEIREILPIGHETAERARHLLDKAHTILHSDPMRSAEVEYYMQQVRAIVQRIRQTYLWSNLYRSRLQLYLSAWALLSFLVLAARFLFPVQFELFWMALTGMGANSTVIRHFPVILATLFAGAMGGAIGALYTMFQHARREYGFFDRKYGLRGIMLPIIGAVVGGLLYALFAGMLQLFGFATTGNLALGLLPAAMAMLFGLGQESLYGTRG